MHEDSREIEKELESLVDQGQGLISKPDRLSFSSTVIIDALILQAKLLLDMRDCLYELNRKQGTGKWGPKL